MIRTNAISCASVALALSGVLTFAGCKKPGTESAVASAAAPAGSTATAAVAAHLPPSLEAGAGARAAKLGAAFTRAEADAKGRLGVTVLHIESGERTAFHDDEAFPMQSVFKLPLAVTLLAQVDAGSARLDESVTVRVQDLRFGPPNALADKLPSGGKRTLGELLETMIIDSDNTAADLLLTRVGGAAKVTAKLRELGIENVDVSRSEAELMFDMGGVTSPPPRATWTLGKLGDACDAVPLAKRRAAQSAYLRDPRDTATPAGMAALLLRIYKRDLLAKASADFLIATLERTATGKAKLTAGFPAGTAIAHKTGGSGIFEGVTAASNDVGIVTLPANAGHVIIAAFLRESKGDEHVLEASLASVGRAVLEAYTAP